MTPEDHNKLLGWGHIGYGILFSLIGLAFGCLMFFVGSLARNDPHPPPTMFFPIIGIFVALFYGLLSIPSIIAGYALLKRKSWAKIAGIIAGVLSAMSFPLGTAVCVYTLWFLFSEPGKKLYDNPREYAWNNSTNPPDWRSATPLNPPGAQDWQASTENWQQQQNEPAGIPRQPPNWR